MANTLPSLASSPPFAIHATLIHSLSPTSTQHLPNTLLIISPSGTISHLIPSLPISSIPSTLSSLSLPSIPITILPWPHSFLIPGLIDTHVHAPQHTLRGLGAARGMQILPWLEEITFPHEARFSDPAHASRVYETCVRSSLKQGITTACYYGSLHLEASKILASTCLKQGQRAFIGKTVMDNPVTNPDFYRDESSSSAIADTRSLINHILTLDPTGSLIRPILTPRFAISCTPPSLSALGALATEYNSIYPGNKGIPLQTHFCEAESEVNATLAQYPSFNSEISLYQHYGLLNSTSVLAHCTTLTPSQIQELTALDVGVCHCPIANSTVGGGFMAAPVKKFLDLEMKVGLGTDSGGGYSSSILDAMRTAVIVGNARHYLTKGEEGRVGLHEVFHMATLGGARVLGLDREIGNFEVGKRFDAVVVDTCRKGDGDEGVMTNPEEREGWESVLEKFVITADDRNMAGVYVQGVKRK